MALKYINITVGTKLASGEQQTGHKGTATSQSGDVSLVWDEATVTSYDALKAATDKALFQARAQGLK